MSRNKSITWSNLNYITFCVTFYIVTNIEYLILCLSTITSFLHSIIQADKHPSTREDLQQPHKICGPPTVTRSFKRAAQLRSKAMEVISYESNAQNEWNIVMSIDGDWSPMSFQNVVS